MLSSRPRLIRALRNHKRLNHTQIDLSASEKATKLLSRLSSLAKDKKRSEKSIKAAKPVQNITNENRAKSESSKPIVNNAKSEGRVRSSRKNKDYTKNFKPADLGRQSNFHYQFHRYSPLIFDGVDNAVLQKTLLSLDSNYKKLSPPIYNDLPGLQHKLSRVLFSPGVHYLQDPRSQVYNFDPHLSEILPVDQFDFDSIPKFLSSTKDKTLSNITKENGAQFYSSTSSMTGVLSHLHYLFSNFRPQSLLEFTKHVAEPFGKFTRGAQIPASIIAKKNGNIYGIESEKSTDREMILSLQGQSLERMLTKTASEFERYKINPLTRKSEIETENEPNVYHYAKMENFIMRSQLDCFDERLPGTGSFDLKTRAVSAVRFDIAKVEKESTGYQIIKNFGTYESFERERHDLVKSTLLKYGLQARIGDMDGIFIAYHNTVRMFGFEYLHLGKIDEILHSFGLPDFHRNREWYDEGSGEDYFEIMDLKGELSSKLADDEFKLSMNLWNKILQEAIKEFPDSSFRFIAKAIPVSDFETKLRVVATPIESEEIEELQNVSKSLKANLIATEGDEKMMKAVIEEQVEAVNSINEKLCKSPLGFDIYVKNFIDGQESHYRHPIYNSLDSTWKAETKFDKLSSKTAGDAYKEFLNERTQIALESDLTQEDGEVNEFVSMLRQYGERGRKLLNTQKDNSEVVWNNE